MGLDCEAERGRKEDTQLAADGLLCHQVAQERIDHPQVGSLEDDTRGPPFHPTQHFWEDNLARNALCPEEPSLETCNNHRYQRPTLHVYQEGIAYSIRHVLVHRHQEEAHGRQTLEAVLRNHHIQVFHRSDQS